MLKHNGQLAGIAVLSGIGLFFVYGLLIFGGIATDWLIEKIAYVFFGLIVLFSVLVRAFSRSQDDEEEGN